MAEHIRVPSSSDFTDPGPWWRGFTGDEGPMLCCPNGHKAFLTGHDVRADGTVNPSVVCPEDSCPWHVRVVLEGWDLGERTAKP